MTTAAKDPALAALIDDYLQAFYQFSPHTAVYLGLHAYDGQAPPRGAAAIQARRRALDQFRARADAIAAARLTPEDAHDQTLLSLAIEDERFRWGEWRVQERNPLIYMDAVDLSLYIDRDFAPLDERVAALTRHATQAPDVLADGRAQLRAPLARPVLETAIEAFSGQATYLRGELSDTIATAPSASVVTAARAAVERLAAATDEFVQALEAQKATAGDDFALGAELFGKMLRYGEMVDLPLDRLLAVGEADLARNRARLVEVARQLDPAATPAQVLDRLSESHPTADSLVPDTAATLDAIRQFIEERQVITIPSSVPAIVKPTPTYMRWGFAFMSSPGPFESKATEAYYYVTPVEEHWSAEEKDAWLRRFDYHTLKDVSVHEVYPGHYVHFQHAQKVTRPLRQVLMSYSFIEGWAHYCEQMMVEAGYEGHDPRLEAAQLREALLRNSRFVCAIGMHTGQMTLDEATAVFQRETFLEELPARKEAVRGTFDPGYLNYTLGKLLLLKLRENLRAKQGAAFSLKAFNDACLAYGAPPVPLLRCALLGTEDGAAL